MKLDSYSLPLLFEPGTSWLYGSGCDWAGKMVERVNNNQTLGSYMQTHIWEPLGMKLTSFRLQERSDIKARRADMSRRDGYGKVVPSPTRFFQENAPDDQGGGGVYSCAGDYIKILISLLKNDGALLKPSSVDMLFSPCLSPPVAKALQTARRQGNESGEATNVGLNFSVGGLLTLEHVKGRRHAGTLSWGGLPNLNWVLDREAGIALLYASQLLPPGDPVSKKTFEKFEEAIYSGELGDIGL
jgi:CubicO group peptidase (beta-lactamase class C family)